MSQKSLVNTQVKCMKILLWSRMTDSTKRPSAVTWINYKMFAKEKERGKKKKS